MNFRYDINALRAIAVTEVLFFHYKAPYFKGGFSGVDVFFVISGYLMTRIIINGLEKGNFSVCDFYAKRLKRIVPALLVLLAIVVLVQFFISFPVDYLNTEKNSLASLFFVSNILYWQGSDYFAPASENNVLLHTWSLSVEWQFYLLYPLVLIALNKVIGNKKVYLTVFCVATIGLALGSSIATAYDSTASFYLLPTRAWEMMAGGIAFYSADIVKTAWKRVAMAVVGYILILVCNVFLHEGMAWPGVYTLIPIAATVLVIVANCNDFPPVRLGIVQFFGKISYSLYLWHWPVFVIAMNVGMPRTNTTILMLMALAIGLAYLSYRYVESVDKSSTRIVAYAGTLAAIIVALVAIDANTIMFKPETLKLSAYARDHKKELDQQFRVGECFMTSRFTNEDFNRAKCLTLSDTMPNVLLIGDSHAAHLVYALQKLFADRNINLTQATASGCLPVLSGKGRTGCVDLINSTYKDYVVKHAAEIDGVIISGNWVSSLNQRKKLLQDIKATLQFLEQHRVKAIILGQNETFRIPYPYISAWEHELGMKLTPMFITHQSADINSFLKRNLPRSYVDVFNAEVQQPVSKNNEPYMFDKIHVTGYGAGMLLQKALADPVGSAFFEALQRH